MADVSDADLRCRMETQEQTTRTQQEALDSIQRLLEELLINQNMNANHKGTSGSNHQEEKNPNENTPMDKQPYPKETSLIDVEVIKGIQMQIASLAQWNEWKKVGMTHPYPLK